MTNRERIAALEFQLKLKHERPATVSRLAAALCHFKEAEEFWAEPGCQVMALESESLGLRALRALEDE